MPRRAIQPERSRRRAGRRRRTAPAGHVLAASCPSREVLDHLTGRWGPLVMLALTQGTARFGELKQRVDGVSEKMLAQTLRALERDGFVEREAFAEIPPRVEYRLTPMGEEAAERVVALTAWVEANLGRVLDAQAAHDDAR